VRKAFLLVLLIGTAACNRGNQNKEAIRQGVVDHLAGSSINVAAMDLDVTSVSYDGDKADATVMFKPKGVPAAQGMTLHYQMQEKGGRWQVVGIQDSGHSTTQPGTPNPHEGGVEGPADNPHGGAMPSPEDLPPTGKK
jgi:hypothetical protein